MNVNISIDCTPEEARRFMGLPDLTPIHETYVHQMTEAMTKGVSSDMVDAMMRSWGPMTDMNAKMFQAMLGGTKS